MPTTRTPSNYLEEAHQIILDPTETYTKEREAQVRSLTRLAEVASGEALAKRNKPISYGPEAKAREFCNYLDFQKFGFENSCHTRGFYERTAALYHHARGTPPKRLFWVSVANGRRRID